jgi:hypothetical protein
LFGHNNQQMGSDYDPRREAEAAMQEALRAEGFDRQHWIQVAQTWLELASLTSPDRRGCAQPPYRGDILSGGDAGAVAF